MITEDQLKKNFAARLAGYRRLAGLTQLELAEKLNYSDKSISRVIFSALHQRLIPIIAELSLSNLLKTT